MEKKKKKAVLTLEETKPGGGDSQITNSDYMVQEEPPGAGKELWAKTQGSFLKPSILDPKSAAEWPVVSAHHQRPGTPPKSHLVIYKI